MAALPGVSSCMAPCFSAGGFVQPGVHSWLALWQTDRQAQSCPTPLWGPLWAQQQLGRKAKAMCKPSGHLLLSAALAPQTSARHRTSWTARQGG